MPDSQIDPSPADSRPEISFAACRSEPFQGISGFPGLRDAWSRSFQTVQSMRKLLDATPPTGLFTVAVSGSLGRMEQTPFSDCDLVVVACDGELSLQSIHNQVWDQLRPLDLGKPDSQGIFSRPVQPNTLLGPSRRGKWDEDVATYGLRMQLLLDCQPVDALENFEQLVLSILSWFAEGSGGVVDWNHLRDELVRYHRSLRVLYRWSWPDRPGYWRLQNLKLLFNRKLMIAALSLLLGMKEAQESDGVAFLGRQLRQTPLERIGFVYDAMDDNGFAVLVNAYEQFVAAVSHVASYESLISEDQTTDPLFQELLQHSRKFARELADFVVRHQNRWAKDFWENLLF